MHIGVVRWQGWTDPEFAVRVSLHSGIVIDIIERHPYTYLCLATPTELLDQVWNDVERVRAACRAEEWKTDRLYFLMNDGVRVQGQSERIRDLERKLLASQEELSQTRSSLSVCRSA